VGELSLLDLEQETRSKSKTRKTNRFVYMVPNLPREVETCFRPTFRLCYPHLFPVSGRTL
jgi:hypothetical protein